ncbi:MAG: NAD kinase [Actinomycetaceae bacterium]|nr:NAD kinase [Actinomycetaceae bacterium]
MARRVMSIVNVNRPSAASTARYVENGLRAHGLEILHEDDTEPVELVLVFGGDGTILWSSPFARENDVPLLGVNVGHMGFLAEADVSSLDEVISSVATGSYTVEERMTLELEVHYPDGEITRDWAMNEAAILRTDLAHPAHLGVGVDGQGVSTYGADGIILATPTGSTAYSFSAGGPVVWPDTEAVLMVPLAAHGLFTRPLLVGPHSQLEVSVLSDQWAPLEIWCDGIRFQQAPAGTRINCRPSAKPVKLARISQTPFSTRLVAKFNLPVSGWRHQNGSSPHDQ